MFVPIIILVMRASIMGCKFGLAIFIGRYLDLAALGLYGLAAGAVAVVPVIVGMGMVHLIMRDAVTLSARQLTDSLLHYWCFTASIYALMLTVALLAILLDVSVLWALVVAIALFEHLGNDVFQLFSNLERPLMANASAFVRGAGWLLVYVPLAIWHPALMSLPTLLGGWLMGSVLAFLLFVFATRSWPWKAAFAALFKVAWVTSTIRRSFVLYTSDLSFVASQYIDRYLVSIFLGVEFAGIYFLYWSIANAANTFVSMAVMQLQRPLLIKAHDLKGVLAHRHLSARFMRETVTATVVIGIAIGGAFHVVLLPLLHQPLVADYLPAFWLILAGMAVRTIADFWGMALFTARRDRLMMITNVASAVTLVFLQVALLPFAGLYGMGSAILVTCTAIIVWRHVMLFGFMPVRVGEIKL